jgi:hypothetical protein
VAIVVVVVLMTMLHPSLHVVQVITEKYCK